MTQQAKAEIIKHYRRQYRHAKKNEKSRIIGVIAESIGYSRKHIIHAANEDVEIPICGGKPPPTRRSRYLLIQSNPHRGSRDRHVTLSFAPLSIPQDRSR